MRVLIKIRGATMGLFIFALAFGFFVLLLFLCTVYVYFRLVKAVKAGEEVPKWMYKLGQSFRFRYSNHYTFDDITDSAALKETNFFILSLILINVIFGLVMHHRTNNFLEALYTVLKLQFALAIISVTLNGIVKLFLVLLKPSGRAAYFYSSSKAVVAAVCFTSFAFTLFMSMTGFPARAPSLQLDKTNVIIGETRAEELLKAGFSFSGRMPDSEIVNKSDEHSSYGELVKLFKDGKPYGLMSLTPEWGTSDKLKNCIITFYSISANNEQLSKVKFSNKELSKLTINDFKTKNLTDIFSLKPADYEEIKNNTFFILKLQTAGYGICKSYSLEANFNSDGSPYSYSIRAKHSIWD